MEARRKVGSLLPASTVSLLARSRARRRAILFGMAITLAAFTLVTSASQTSRDFSTYRTWAAYGGGPEQLRYSSLRQINRDNVKQLQVAWTYESAVPAISRRNRLSSTERSIRTRRRTRHSRSTRPPGRRSGASTRRSSGAARIAV